MRKSPLLILFLVVFIDLVGFGIVIPILPYYAKAYGATATQLGWLMASYSLLQFIFAPIWGKLSDQVGRRPVLLLSMAGTMFSMVMLGQARSLYWIFMARAFAGICGANISTATAYVTDVTTPENRAKGMGMIGAAFGVGFIFGPAIGGVLSRYGYSTPMFAAAALSGINIIFAIFKLPEPPLTAELREKNRAKRFSLAIWKEALGDYRTRKSIITFFLVTTAMTQMEVSFALYMAQRFGFDAQRAGWLLALMGVVMASVQGGLIGKLSKAFGEHRLVLVGSFVMASGLVLFAYSGGALTWLIVGLVAFALGNGVMNPSLSSLASQGARPERRGVTMGVYHSAGSLARVVGPPLAGLMFDRKITLPFLSASAMLWMVGLGWLFLKSESKARNAFLTLLSNASQTFRKSGFKGLIKTYGWKFVIILFFYYLIRDVTLYILLPWLIAKGVITL